jgi:RND family efflux transporter MFP subunit
MPEEWEDTMMAASASTDARISNMRSTEAQFKSRRLAGLDGDASTHAALLRAFSMFGRTAAAGDHEEPAMPRCESSSFSSGLTALVMLTAVGLAACTPSESATGPATDPRSGTQLVRIATVQPAKAAVRGFTGVVSARIQSNLGFRVSGKVTERLVDTGQTVKVGQPLMRIDRTEYAHAITAQIGNVAAARARVIQTAADEARYRGLVATGAVSKAAYDQAKAAADGAGALLSAAEAQLKVAQDEGDYSTLLADTDGTVVETLAEPGQVVSTGQPVVKLAQAGPREATINLPETVRPGVGSTAQASLYGSDTSGPARLRQLSDAADPVTRTYDARYVLGGDAARAPLGATVTVYLTDPHQASASAVPIGAITDEGKGPGVWVLDGSASAVSFRPVRIAEFGGESVIISDGVRVGETIVALGGHFLHQGQIVRTIDNSVPDNLVAGNQAAADQRIFR